MRICIGVVMIVTALPVSAWAQNVGGPFGGLFGRTPPPTGFEVTALEFRTSVGGQFDDDLAVRGFESDGRPTSGLTAGVATGLAFERRVERMRFTARGGTTYQQFYQVPRFDAWTYDASSLFTASVGSRFTVDASANAIRSPFYQISPVVPSAGPLPEVTVPGDPYAVRLLANDNLEGTAGISTQYSKRSTLSFGVTGRQTRFSTQPDNNFYVLGAHGQWRHRLSRDLAVRLGYGRERARTQSLGESIFIHETIDIGLDFEREITVARRTALTAFTQTSILKENGGERRYRLNGGASLARGFKRTWSSSLIFNRTTEFLAGFTTPLFSDTLSMAVAGQLSQRVEWSGGIGAGRSLVGFGNDRFYTASGTTRLSAGLTHHLGVYAQYTYYHYEVPLGSLVVALLPQMSRQSVSVGISTWVPIIHRMRAPSDPR